MTPRSYDLVCAEGIIQALRVFTGARVRLRHASCLTIDVTSFCSSGKSPMPTYVVNTPEKPLTFTVSKSVRLATHDTRLVSLALV